VNELVRFLQPGQTAVALNRVTGVDPSTILGQLIANGQVFILNPNGVVFGSSAKVDVAGLIASTLKMSDADFMAGNYSLHAKPGADPGVVVNRGEIKVADNGFVFLVAPSVRNEGLIIANLGKVVLGAGDKAKVDFQGDGLINWEVSGKLLEQLVTPDGQTLESAASNAGTIRAHGGTVVLTGDAALQIVSSVVSQEGAIDARSVSGSQGQVALQGRGDGIVLNTGTISVSGMGAGAGGGEISLTGDLVGQGGLLRASGIPRV
jgi:filamentous hemagglutinin family protein